MTTMGMRVVASTTEAPRVSCWVTPDGISALMDEAVFYHWLVIAWIALAADTFIALIYVTAP